MVNRFWNTHAAEAQVFFGADAVGKVLWPHVIEFVDRLALLGREQRILLAQFGPKAGFRNLRFNREAKMAFLRFNPYR
jgi:hypothetical protein